MQIDPLVVLRPRSPWEGCDLGTRLLQARLRAMACVHLAVAVPLFALFLLTHPIAGWLPPALAWLSKPWLDRTILFALSRSLFGERTTLRDVWRQRREVWLAGLAVTLTSQRLSASRAFTQPIVQLEGLSGRALGQRIALLTSRHRGVARALTLIFANAELALVLSLVSLEVWLAPHGSQNPQGWVMDWLEPAPRLTTTLAYLAAIAFLEPFYVAAGFGMYVNRRVELEAWDIEQEFRRAFAA